MGYQIHQNWNRIKRKNNKRWEYFLLFMIFGIIGINELSLNLSANQKMESKIKEFVYIPDIQYSINVYQFNMKRELN